MPGVDLPAGDIAGERDTPPLDGDAAGLAEPEGLEEDGPDSDGDAADFAEPEGWEEDGPDIADALDLEDPCDADRIGLDSPSFPCLPARCRRHF